MFVGFVVTSGRSKMVDSTYQPKVYRRQGGDVQVVASGGEINVEAGGKVTAAGTQAANIASTTATATFSATIHAQITDLINAVEGVGITATS